LEVDRLEQRGRGEEKEEGGERKRDRGCERTKTESMFHYDNSL